MATKPKTDNKVGYQTPPIKSQFKKGVSGNPKGRPKSKTDASTALDKALRQRVVVNQDGTQKTISKLEAMATQLANKGAQGDSRATQQVLTALQKLGDESTPPAPPKVLTETDQQVIANVVARIRKSSEGENDVNDR